MIYTREVKTDVRDFKEEQNKAHLNYSADFMEKPWVLGENMRQRRLHGDRRNSNRKPSLLFAIPAWAGDCHSPPVSSALLPTSRVTYITQGMLLEFFAAEGRKPKTF